MSRLSRLQSREETRHRLRSASVQAFAQAGVGGASIDRIAAAAGFSRGAFYANYAGKRDLLLELVHESHVAEVAVWTGLISQAPDLAAMMDALSARFDAFAGREDWARLHVELELEAGRDPEFGRAYAAQREQVLHTVAELVRSLFAKAGRPAPPQAERIARTLRALSLGLLLQAGERDVQHGDVRSGAILADFLRGALAASGAPRHLEERP